MLLNQVFFYQEAWNELLAAINEYNSKATGLGRQFLKAVERGIKQISEDPQSFSFQQDTQTRVYSLHRLPYTIYFICLNEHQPNLEPEIWIVGIEKIENSRRDISTK
jgi:hypothetical protein